jgi:hypothetical protein
MRAFKDRLAQVIELPFTAFTLLALSMRLPLGMPSFIHLG